MRLPRSAALLAVVALTAGVAGCGWHGGGDPPAACDANEPNDTNGSATAVPVDGPTAVEGCIDPAGDVDIFTFDGTGAGAGSMEIWCTGDERVEFYIENPPTNTQNQSGTCDPTAEVPVTNLTNSTGAVRVVVSAEDGTEGESYTLFATYSP